MNAKPHIFPYAYPPTPVIHADQLIDSDVMQKQPVTFTEMKKIREYIEGNDIQDWQMSQLGYRRPIGMEKAKERVDGVNERNERGLHFQDEEHNLVNTFVDSQISVHLGNLISRWGNRMQRYDEMAVLCRKNHLQDLHISLHLPVSHK